MNSIVWYKSKTLWVAFVALIASLVQARYGLIIDGATQGIILTIIFIILRIDTHGSVTATKAADPVGDAQVYAVQAEATAVKAVTAAESAEAAVDELKSVEKK